MCRSDGVPGVFVRVRDPHPLAGMTGTVIKSAGRTVTVRLTSWGICRTFDVAELRQEKPAPAAVTESESLRFDHVSQFWPRLRESRKDAAA